MCRVMIGALAVTLTLGAATPGSISSAVFDDPEPAHTLADPGEAGLSVSGLEGARAAIQAEIRRGGTPGATIAVGRGPAIVLEEAFGRIGWTASTDRTDPDRTIYDLASLTKVVATTAAAMLLYEDGRLDLNDAVSDHLPEFRYRQVTFHHLLTHTSGLPPGLRLRNLSPSQARARVLQAPLHQNPGREVVYSDLGFIILWYALERIAGEPLPELLARRIYKPLGMHSTTFEPGAGCQRCAPTKLLKSGRMVRGTVHDPTAEVLGGIAGHAGLFSTAHDLARFAAMLASGGEYEGTRIFDEETLNLFTTVQPDAESRALGWDTPSQDPEVLEESTVQSLSPYAFGHYGFTGTSIWVDPATGLWMVVLTNRVYAPRARNGIRDLRRTIHDQLALAVLPGDSYAREAPHPGHQSQSSSSQ